MKRLINFGAFRGEMASETTIDGVKSRFSAFIDSLQKELDNIYKGAVSAGNITQVINNIGGTPAAAAPVPSDSAASGPNIYDYVGF